MEKKTMNQQDQFEINDPTNQPAIQSSSSENAAGTESLADLALTGARAEVTKGGIPALLASQRYSITREPLNE
jgi:hypothetical protein